MPLSLTRARRRWFPEPPEITPIHLAEVVFGILLAKLSPQFLTITLQENLLEHLFVIAPPGFGVVLLYFVLVKTCLYPGLPFSLQRRMHHHLAFVGFGFVLGGLAFYGQVDWVYLVSAGATIELAAFAADVVCRRWLE